MSRLVKLDDGSVFDMDRIVAGAWLSTGEYRVYFAESDTATDMTLPVLAGQALLDLIPSLAEMAETKAGA